MRLTQAIQERLVFGSYALMVVFGWWVPNDVMESSPQLRAFTDFMARIVPQIDRVTALGGSTAGNANRVLFSVLWVVGIILGIAYVVMGFRKAIAGRFFASRSPTPFWKTMLYSTLAVYLFWWEGLYMTSLRPELRLVKFSLINRFGTGLCAPLLSISLSILVFGGALAFFAYAVNVVRKIGVMVKER